MEPVCFELVHEAKLTVYMWDITSHSIVFLCIHVFWSGHQLTWLATATWWWVAFLPSWFRFKFFATASCFFSPFFGTLSGLHRCTLNTLPALKWMGGVLFLQQRLTLWLNEACCNGKAPEGITMRKTMFYFFCIQHFRFKRLVFFSFFFLNWAHFCKLK